jgi:hypothetical protein
MFGSTAAHVVREAACPVLVVREIKTRQPARAEREAVAAAVGGSASGSGP